MHKPWYQSSTLWVGLLAALIEIGTDQQILSVLSPAWAHYISAAALVFVVVKRAIPSASQGGLTLTQAGATAANEGGK